MAIGDRLAHRVALVTGGGGEIGAAICRRFAAEGAEVAIADLDPTKSEAAARAITASGGRAQALRVDVADEASAKGAVERTVAKFGRLTTLVNVAATVTPDGTVETLSLDDWNSAIAVNLTGAFVMCKYAVPELRRAGGGSIINIASQLGHLGVPLRSPYCTTKAALIHFTRILAMDHAVDKIRCRQNPRQHDLSRLHPDRTLQPPFRRQGAGARCGRAAPPAQSAWRAGGNRRRCGLSCLRRRGIRHCNRSFDRWRLCRLQRPDRRRRPTRYDLTIGAVTTQRFGLYFQAS
jgi:NADP-dependent 3-hydroxy acid dehydrogenase YdfG